MRMLRVMTSKWKWIYVGMAIDLILKGVMGYFTIITLDLGQAIVSGLLFMIMMMVAYKLKIYEFSMLNLGYAITSLCLALLGVFGIYPFNPLFLWIAGLGMLIFSGFGELLYWMDGREKAEKQLHCSIKTSDHLTYEAEELVMLLEKAKKQARLTGRIQYIDYSTRVIGVASDSDIQERILAYQLLKAGLIDSAADPMKTYGDFEWRI